MMDSFDTSGIDYAVLENEVRLFQALLEEEPPAHPAELLEAMECLRSLGDLPTRMLQDTKVGLTVAKLSRESASGDVRGRAAELLEEWKCNFRKRKAKEPLRGL